MNIDKNNQIYDEFFDENGNMFVPINSDQKTSLGVPKMVINKPFFRRLAYLYHGLVIINRKHKIKRLEYIISSNRTSLTGDLDNLDKLNRFKELVGKRNQLDEEIKARKRLRRILIIKGVSHKRA